MNNCVHCNCSLEGYHQNTTYCKDCKKHKKSKLRKYNTFLKSSIGFKRV